MATTKYSDTIASLLTYEALQQLIMQGKLLAVPTDNWSYSEWFGGTFHSFATYLEVDTSDTPNSGAKASTDLSQLNPGVAPSSAISYDRKLIFSFLLTRLHLDSEVVGRVQIKTVNTEGAFADKGIGLRVDNLALVGESYGSSLGGTDLGTTLSDDRPVRIDIILDPGVSIEWKVEGVSKGRQTTAANFPTGTANGYLVVSIANGPTGGVEAWMKFGAPIIWQKHP